MKKILMIAASLTVGSAGLAQNNMGSTMASGGYPACSATVTDSCIQLYERGVRTSTNLALNSSRSTMAVGGPYEPVTAANAQAGHDGIMEHPATVKSGVGGPVEERTGYPPCDPGPGDDQCIQLYERGVTGTGN